MIVAMSSMQFSLSSTVATIFETLRKFLICYSNILRKFNYIHWQSFLTDTQITGDPGPFHKFE